MPHSGHLLADRDRCACVVNINMFINIPCLPFKYVYISMLFVVDSDWKRGSLVFAQNSNICMVIVTGAHVLAPIPGVWPAKPGSATLPFFGVQPAMVNEQVSTAAAQHAQHRTAPSICVRNEQWSFNHKSAHHVVPAVRTN